jgi:hypothetical protein
MTNLGACTPAEEPASGPAGHGIRMLDALVRAAHGAARPPQVNT